MARRRQRGRGEGTVYQRADGRWMGQVMVGYTDEGKPDRPCVYGWSQGEVREKLEELKRKARDGTLGRGDMLVKNFFDFWLAGHRHKLAANTVERYELDLSYARPHLGHLRLDKVTGFNVTKMYQKLEEKGYSTDARRKCGVRLRQVFKAAVKSRLISYNPAEEVSLPSHQAEEIHPLDPAQVTAFLRATEQDRLYALYVVALDTGARMGELFALEWSDWDEARGTLRFVKALRERDGYLEIKVPKTKASRRTLDLGPTAQAALRAHRERMAAEGHGGTHVFCDNDGGWLRQGNVHRRSFKPALQRAGLPPVRFHDLRHTCATLLLLGGTDVVTIARRLGHSSVQLVHKTYGHTLPAMQSRAAQTIDQYLRVQ